MERLQLKAMAAGIGLAGIALVGCANEPSLAYNRPGVIVQHEYDDPDVVAVKPLIIDPEHFLVHVRQCGVPAEDGEEECQTLAVEVSERYYNDYPDNTHLSADEINALKN